VCGGGGVYIHILHPQRGVGGGGGLKSKELGEKVPTLFAYSQIRTRILLPFRASRLLYVPSGLTLKNSTWCSHCVNVFFLPILRQTETLALQISRLIFNN